MIKYLLRFLSIFNIATSNFVCSHKSSQLTIEHQDQKSSQVINFGSNNKHNHVAEERERRKLQITLWFVDNPEHKTWVFVLWPKNLFRADVAVLLLSSTSSLSLLPFSLHIHTELWVHRQCQNYKSWILSFEYQQKKQKFP
jgi:hypothetical protein